LSELASSNAPKGSKAWEWERAGCAGSAPALCKRFLLAIGRDIAKQTLELKVAGYGTNSNTLRGVAGWVYERFALYTNENHSHLKNEVHSIEWVKTTTSLL
jgi:hypothetical protein